MLTYLFSKLKILTLLNPYPIQIRIRTPICITVSRFCTFYAYILIFSPIKPIFVAAGRTHGRGAEGVGDTSTGTKTGE